LYFARVCTGKFCDYISHPVHEFWFFVWKYTVPFILIQIYKVVAVQPFIILDKTGIVLWKQPEYHVVYKKLDELVSLYDLDWCIP
jgi:hypothetical protein